MEVIMNSVSRIALLGGLMLFSACSKPLEVGTLVPTPKFEFLKTDLKNNGKRIAFDGFVTIGDTSGFGMTVFIDPDNINAEVTVEANGEGSRLTYIKPDFGKGANQIFFPEKGSIEDVLITTNDGKSFQVLKQKLRISATVNLDASKTGQTLMGEEKIIKNVMGEMKLNIPKLVTTYAMTLTDLRFDLP
jgi:hypothetical protein